LRPPVISLKSPVKSAYRKLGPMRPYLVAYSLGTQWRASVDCL
jgi:hypothetical protein